MLLLRIKHGQGCLYVIFFDNLQLFQRYTHFAYIFLCIQSIQDIQRNLRLFSGVMEVIQGTVKLVALLYVLQGPDGLFDLLSNPQDSLLIDHFSGFSLYRRDQLSKFKAVCILIKGIEVRKICGGQWHIHCGRLAFYRDLEMNQSCFGSIHVYPLEYSTEVSVSLLWIFAGVDCKN